MSTTQDAPAASVLPQVPYFENSEALVPVIVLVMLSVVVPVLVMVTDLAALVVPTVWFPNARLVVESLTTAVVPIPLSDTVCGEPAASSVMVNDAVAAPEAVGEN